MSETSSNQRRRVVFMDDTTWDNLTALADGQQLTRSEVLRRALQPPFNHIVATSGTVANPATVFVEVGTPGRTDLSSESRGTDQVIGSFGTSRPAPKPAGRKR